MEPSIENLNKAAATNGLILGIISLIINIVVYYVSPASMGSTFAGIGLMLLSLILYIVFTLDLRKKIGGYWSFREALKGIFIMALVAGLIDAVLKTIFYKYIEPGAYDKIIGFVESSLTATYENMGMDQAIIDTTVDKIKEGLKSQFNPSLAEFLKSLGIVILIEFIMSLIFAAIFKKEPPVFAAANEE